MFNALDRFKGTSKIMFRHFCIQEVNIGIDAFALRGIFNGIV
jgi:hypothetical protein